MRLHSCVILRTDIDRWVLILNEKLFQELFFFQVQNESRVLGSLPYIPLPLGWKQERETNKLQL